MTTPDTPPPLEPTPAPKSTSPGLWILLGAVIVLVIIAVIYLGGDGETDDTTVTTETTEEECRNHESRACCDYRACGERRADRDHGGLLRLTGRSVVNPGQECLATGHHAKEGAN